MIKKLALFFAFLPLVATLFTFGLSGGIASAHSVIPLSVGGCSEHTGGPNNSFEMGVCISDRNTSLVYSDVYVNTQPTGPFTCTLFIELWRTGGGKIYQDAGHSCTIRHYDSTRVIMPPNCGEYHTSAWISYFGAFYRIGDSPSFTYC